MTRITKGLVATGIATVVALAMAPTASARAVGGASAITGYNGFTENWGTLVNSSGTTKGAEIQLVVDSATSYTPTIGVLAVSAGDVVCGCVSQASDNNGGFQNWTTNKQPATVGSPTTFQPGTVTVPSGGFLFCGCSIAGDGSTLYQVTY